MTTILEQLSDLGYAKEVYQHRSKELAIARYCAGGVQPKSWGFDRQYHQQRITQAEERVKVALDELWEAQGRTAT